MTNPKILAVVGATGAQGGGLARAALDDPDRRFRVRALTRDPSSDKARALAERGAEVVAADLDDASSLAGAFEGAHAAFCLTNFWEHFSPERELAQARNMATAAREAGLQHVIWSTLEDTRKRVPLSDARMPTLMQKYKVPHFDAKGEADRFFVESDVPTTFLLTSFYWDNLIHFGMGPRRGEDGVLTFALPIGAAKLPGIAAEDIGRCAFGIFASGRGSAGQHVGIAGEHPTGAEMAATLARVLGEPVRWQAVPFADYRKLGFPGADDLGNMFQFKHDFNAEFCRVRDPRATRKWNPKLKTFAEWAGENRARLVAG